MADIKPLIAKAADGHPLTGDEARQAFDIIMSGDATPAQIGGFLMGLRVRGETVDEIVGAVATMRAKMRPVKTDKPVIDIVGTGGDNSGSYNVSTIARCIDGAGLGFMFAPVHHPAMRHVGPYRVELGTRTIFNLLGPLSNPASASRQVVGVFAPHWVEPLAHVLKALGSEHVWVVHGEGLDELTTAGETMVAELRDGAVHTFTLAPVDAGLPRARPDDLKGGAPAENAAALRAVLEGAHNAYRDIACLNAGAGLVVAGLAGDIAEGVTKAQAALDDGSAKAVLDKVVAISTGKG